jgi:hypothetical protein
LVCRGMKDPSSMSVPMPNRAFPYEKPQVERSEALDVYAGVFHENRDILESRLQQRALIRPLQVTVQHFFDGFKISDC